MKHILFSITLLCFFTARAQQQDSLSTGDFIYTYSKKFIPYENIEYIKKPFKPAYIQADSVVYNMSHIMFYQSNRELFANTRHLTGVNDFARCIERGNVNIFNRSKTYYNSEVGTSTTTHEYINKGLTPIVKANLYTIEQFVNDDPKSMEQLEKIRSYRSAGIMVLVTGLSLGVYGLASNNKGVAITGGVFTFLQYPIMFSMPSKSSVINLYNK